MAEGLVARGILGARKLIKGKVPSPHPALPLTILQLVQPMIDPLLR
jgi:hypothetical protein